MTGLRNRPGGLAWIQIPAKYRGTGFETLCGHYVTTECLNVNGRWVVDPPQSFVATGPCTLNGIQMFKGEFVKVLGISDAYLIPVPDFDFREEEGAEQDNLGVVGKVRA